MLLLCSRSISFVISLNVFVYFDDILIYSKDPQYFICVWVVLQRLIENQL